MLAPPSVPRDWLWLCAHSLLDNSQVLRTAVWLPGANSSNDRPLPLKQSQGHKRRRGGGWEGDTHWVQGSYRNNRIRKDEVYQCISVYLCLTVFFVPYNRWHKLHHGLGSGEKLEELLKSSLSFVHNLFMTTSVSIYHLYPRSLFHIHNFLHLPSASRFLHSVTPSSLFLCLHPSPASAGPCLPVFCLLFVWVRGGF